MKRQIEAQRDFWIASVWDQLVLHHQEEGLFIPTDTLKLNPKTKHF